MKSMFHKIPLLVTALLIIAASFFLPSFSWAAHGSAEFYVSAWLVRIWLALVSGTVIVVGVMLAIDSYDDEHRTEPVLTSEKKVVLEKRYSLSYRKISGGLLCVIVGGALFTTSVFLLPDKRTGHSGLGKIAARFEAEQATPPKALHDNENSMPSDH